jgi:hypothetical protein
MNAILEIHKTENKKQKIETARTSFTCSSIKYSKRRCHEHDDDDEEVGDAEPSWRPGDVDDDNLSDGECDGRRGCVPIFRETHVRRRRVLLAMKSTTVSQGR